ncbi:MULTISPECIES: LysR family transcriptional regulator [Burkholderia]|uniref:LysR family transcriptional regulator n=1 Tax=Burkholderia cenocepacia TaxID=95486 RepID=A0AAD0IWW4_9BURK|nr:MULTISPECIES: LysR family transcriptional regulator [Burkholderia]EAY65280.1 Transcriptional regulator [Burkholderia cenocepacia PC184]AWG27707.1 LysR family transcriptional regulator [Burkholderia cenocepacia]MBL3965567.1 LysR family transcriptional regulator [Burkholderia sp. KCJ3K979]MBR8307710.1 LysR family transcriptional regulator [Burkholderia cenocepacia]MCA7961853.1 LysR family transcriptional regulator [Burkholderia cenocepacia]
MDRLKALTVFVRVAVAGGISAGARELAMTPQAASKQVAALEALLNVRLFQRSTHRIALTVEGERLLAQCRGAVGELETALRMLDDDRVHAVGTLRVAAPYSLARRFLAPLLGEFCDQHPGMTAELVVSDDMADIVEQRIDLAVRTGDLPDSGLIARRIAELQLVVCAAPAYLRRHGAPQTIDALRDHRCTAFLYPRTGKPFPWEFLVDGRVDTRQIDPFIATNDIDAELDTVLSGAAIGQFFGYSVHEHVREGRLVPLLTRHVTCRYGLYLCMPQREHLPRRNRLLMDFLVARLGAHPDLAPLSFAHAHA